jgi:hypothetical protein
VGKPQDVATAEVVFLEGEEVLDAEIVEPGDADILFIE